MHTPFAVVSAGWEDKPPFQSPYQGPNSFRGPPQDAVSHSYTLYTGVPRSPGWISTSIRR
jgi:hypothetical protein